MGKARLSDRSGFFNGLLVKDKAEMLAFFDFPAKHWIHLRTSNPIESTFATVRQRTSKTKGGSSRKAVLAMVYKHAMSAEQRWRRLNGSEHLGALIEGVQFKDGINSQAEQQSSILLCSACDDPPGASANADRALA